MTALSASLPHRHDFSSSRVMLGKALDSSRGCGPKCSQGGATQFGVPRHQMHNAVSDLVFGHSVDKAHDTVLHTHLPARRDSIIWTRNGELTPNLLESRPRILAVVARNTLETML